MITATVPIVFKLLLSLLNFLSSLFKKPLIKPGKFLYTIIIADNIITHPATFPYSINAKGIANTAIATAPSGSKPVRRTIMPPATDETIPPNGIKMIIQAQVTATPLPPLNLRHTGKLCPSKND